MLQCWIIVEFLFIYFFYVETKGPTLEEIMKIFDGDDIEFNQLDVGQIQKETRILEHAETVGNTEGEVASAKV